MNDVLQAIGNAFRSMLYPRMLALLYYVPVLNLLAPMLSGLAFAQQKGHQALDALAPIRQAQDGFDSFVICFCYRVQREFG